METLYIIGNGFDLHHGLPTKYTNFYRYVAEHHKDLRNNLEDYFEFSGEDKDLWKNFEADLCHFKYENFLSDYNNIDVTAETFRPSDCFDLEDEMEEETEKLEAAIRDAFESWILSIELPEKDDRGYQRIRIEKNALFINFNYTDTLEELYGITKDHILYIHNNANKEFGELIFGHGEDKEDHPAGPELDEEGNSNRTPFTDAENTARALFYNFRKDTGKILKEHQAFFDRLKKIDKIIVLGHSLGKVDLPYFEEVARQASSAEWHISYYNDDEKTSFPLTAASIEGIDSSYIRMIELKALCFPNK